ncbi:MAG: hypothetical protein ACRDHW_04800 [Ktedonobacteraceae bacterium]
MLIHTKLEELLAQARLLSPEDQTRLVEGLMADLRQRLGAYTQPRYSVLDFEGIGHETWKDVDIDEYIKEERASWDG